MKTVIFPYLPDRQNALMPYVFVELEHESRKIEHMALVDSGAVSSVMPYSMGLALGFDWESGRDGPGVRGALESPSKIVRANISIPQFPTVETSFSWVRRDDVPLILGQRTFFYQSMVGFDGRKPAFTLTLRED
jgi:hypothetical protein